MSGLVPSVNIVGVGLVTALGNDASQTWQSLLAGQFIRDHAPARDFASPRILSMSDRAAHEALAQSQWDVADTTKPIFLVAGTSKGPVEEWVEGRCHRSGLAGWIEELAPKLGLAGATRITMSAACASGLHALIRGASMIRNGEANRVLVIAAEASVLPLFLASFDRLGVLARPHVGCRPFDARHEGFLMGEAAAAVCLQSAAAEGSVLVETFAMGGDASHLTSGDPQALTLRHLLKQVSQRVAHRPIDLIHAHGTGTQINDDGELNALESLFAAREQAEMPLLYSHKAALGHTLGAAGLVSVVINVQCHRLGVVPPNPLTTDPLPMNHVCLGTGRTTRHVRYSLAIAAGFGGATAIVGLSA